MKDRFAALAAFFDQLCAAENAKTLFLEHMREVSTMRTKTVKINI